MLKDMFNDHIDSWWYNTLSIFSNVYSKTMCAIVSFFGLQAVGFYGDEVLLGLVFKLVVLDLLVGVWDACRNKRWSPKLFLVRGIVKFPLYAFYIYLVASLDNAGERTFGTAIPIVEIFYLYLISGEVYSISRHLKYLGFKVPEPLLWLAFGFKKNTRDKFKNICDTDSDLGCKSESGKTKSDSKDKQP